MEFGLEPIDLRDGSAQVVDDQRASHPAKMPEGILYPADEVLRRLPPKDLGITFARVTQDHPQDMGTTPASVLHHPSPLAKIDLGFLSGLTLHPPERQRMGRVQLPHKTLHRIIAANELVLVDQVLINPLSGQACVQTRFDHALERRAMTDAAGLAPGGRNGWFCRLRGREARGRRHLWAGGHNGGGRPSSHLRPGGHNGWF